LAGKRGRAQQNAFIIEGLKLVEEALRYQVHISFFLVSDSFYHGFQSMIAGEKTAQVYLVPDDLFMRVSTTETPQGVLAVAPLLDHEDSSLADRGTRFVILERLQDPGNMGTIIRTADACGFDGVLLSPCCADQYNPKVIRSAMGSVFHIPVLSCADIYDALNKLKDRGIRIVAAHTRDSEVAWSLPLADMIAVVIGNEGSGLSQRMLDAVDIRVMIPMPGKAESLNAASAASMILYESMRQRMTST
jgi:TrmH family RNA methyltransferase